MGEVKKIVVLGGESTGKSTLCEALAHHYDTSWVPEYARSYLENLERDYIESDLKEIAIGQLALEQMMYEVTTNYLFFDTDLHVLKVWSEYKYGRCDTFILNQLNEQQYDAYIITSPDFPWQPDALREHPEPALRDYFFNEYLSLVKNTGCPFCIVQGNEHERLKAAVEFVDGLK